MNTFSVSAVPLDLIKPAVAAPSAGGAADTADQSAKRAAISKTAKDFESSFLSNMLGQMFEGLSTEAPFGGGQGEAMFRSVLMDAFGKQITKAGGVGVAAAVQREMLKMQGLA
jgi:Rod binding domain-containing protein